MEQGGDSDGDMVRLGHPEQQTVTTPIHPTIDLDLTGNADDGEQDSTPDNSKPESNKRKTGEDVTTQKAKKAKVEGWRIESLHPVLTADKPRPSRPLPKHRIHRTPQRVTTADQPSIKDATSSATYNDSHPDQAYIFDLAKTAVDSIGLGQQFSLLDDRERARFSMHTPVTDNAQEESDEDEEDVDIASRHTHLDYKVPQISDIHEVFEDIALRAKAFGFEDALTALQGRPLRIVTMCSGTESPVLAMRLLKEALEKQGCFGFNFEHLAAAEIEPFKQAYIQRNFSPKTIFRDVTEFRDQKGKGPDEVKPHTVYGGVAEKPKFPHILIAGSSCVDYSHLNKAPKKFGQPGESWSTMKGILDYANFARPNIIILENVKNAPWQDIRKELRKLDYDADAVIVDSKNFYVPQTRQRGYLVAFDGERAKQLQLGPKEIQERLNGWKDCMRNFQRRASSPYTEFLIADDEPALDEIKQKIALNRAPPHKSHNWNACKQRHADFRASHNFGSSRSITNWQNNGSVLFTDAGWQAWIKSQPERIWDTLDINQARYVSTRDIDMTYKHRILDLSQNVDREVDSKQWGIVGCLTPSGMPYETRRGGPIVGREALALQGIPVDDLILTKESSRQLQDLAGNAMTTTVVGSAIFSAIMVGAGIGMYAASPGSIFLKDYSGNPGVSNAPTFALVQANSVPPPSYQDIVSTQMSSPREINQSLDLLRQYPMSELVSLASRTRQLCKCEGFAQTKTAGLNVCIDCGHTACSDCAGNPQHNYTPIPNSVLGKRLPVADFTNALIEALPRSLQLASLNTSDINVTVEVLVETTSDWLQCITKALLESYRFKTIKRSREWKVQYESPTARLELRFVPSFLYQFAAAGSIFESLPIDCYWLLFAKCGRSEPADSKTRAVLKDAIAKMTPAGSLLEGMWHFRNPSKDVSSVAITAEGDLIKAWENRLGLRAPPFSTLNMHSAIGLSIPDSGSTSAKAKSSSLCGTYELLPKCGGACGSLHRFHQSTPESPAMFFFLDPHPMGDAREDSYVIANQHERRPSHDRRELLARLPKGWRSTETTLGDCTSLEILCDWVARNDIKLKVSSPEKSVRVALATPALTIKDSPATTCGNGDATFLVTEIPLNNEQQRRWSRGKSYQINLVNHSESLKSLDWALAYAGKSAVSTDWQDVSILLPTGDICHDCVPTPCLQIWQWTRARKSKRLLIKPFEDPENADIFEQQLKSRPAVSSAIVHSHGQDAVVEVHLNLAALCHRALGLIVKGQKGFGKDLTVQWRISSYDKLSSMPQFTEVEISSNSDRPLWSPANCLMDPIFQSQTTQLAFPRGFAPRRRLWDAQRHTLNWMQTREVDCSDWVESEWVEISLPNLDWTVEVQINQPKYVKGGIIADDIGSGKTTTALALVATDLENIQTPPVSEAGDTSATHIWSEATLILVPKNILGQWNEEIEKCFGSLNVLLCIETMEGLRATDIDAVKGAKIILAPWDLFDHDLYWSSMRQLCCAPNVPQPAGRAFQQWHQESLHDLGQLVQFSAECTQLNDFWTKRDEISKSNIEKYKTFTGYRKRKDIDHKGSKVTESAVPVSVASQAFDSSEYQEAAPQPVEAEVEVDDDYLETMNKWPADEKRIYPLFHLFSFRRLIVDEFTYLRGKSLLATLSLETRSRWMLSGTPPVAEYDKVNTMAKLLGTKISSVDEHDGCFGFGKDGGRMSNEKSYVEEFLDYQSKISVYSHQRRYELARDFVQKFMRKDAANLNGRKAVVRVIIIPPSVIELTTYFETYLPLSSQTCQFNRKGPASRVTSRRERIIAAIALSTCAEHALVCCNSEFRPTMEDNFSFQTILESSEADFIQKFTEISSLLQEAFWYSAKNNEIEKEHPHFPALLRKAVSGGDIGNETIARLMDEAIAHAHTNPQAPKEVTESDKTGKDSKDAPVQSKASKDETRERAIQLTKRVDELVELSKSTRLHKAVSSITEDGKLLGCSSCGKKNIEYDKTYIIDICGHVVCKTCFTDATRPMEEQGSCPENGCNSVPSLTQLVSADSFNQSNTSPHTKNGSKMDAIVNAIQAVDPKEFVLVFVQYPAIKKHLIEALKDADVAHVDATTRANSVVPKFVAHADAVRSGKKISKSSTNPRALIMMLDSADSAGWNLQCVNHVMFVNPLVVKSQYDYDATTNQAIGRALRFGQDKDVQVYHFATARTVEVNILEQRHQKAIVKRGAVYEFVPFGDVEPGEQRFTGAALRESNFEVEEVGED